MISFRGIKNLMQMLLVILKDFRVHQWHSAAEIPETDSKFAPHIFNAWKMQISWGGVFAWRIIPFSNWLITMDHGDRRSSE